MVDAVTAGPRPRDGLMAITPYKGGAARVEGVADSVKLSANENALGCSPAARAAAVAAAESLALYPEGSALALREALAARYDLDPDRIVCGAGSDEVLTMLARAYAGPGEEILYSAHGFLVYRLAARQVGATPVAAPETNLTADVDALLDHVTERTRLVYLANPNNPTGTYLPGAELARLHAGLPEHVLLVVDGAYAEFMTAEDYDSGLELARTAPNVVVTRTFSKIHGLAALRLGWGYGPRTVIDVLHRVRGPFNVGAPSMRAGEAALGDRDFEERSRAHNTAALKRVSDAARQHGLLASESVGNFVLMRFTPEHGLTAGEADAALKRRGFILREMGAYGLPDCLRLTIGAEAQNTAVLSALADVLAAARA